tara:strand:- start:36 stop:392 length:357 start_codon:yes stop_codon:yes gene_type:complete
MGILTRFKILGNSIMDVVQFHIALSLYNEFQSDGVDAFEWWRDCASVVHFTAVHKRKVLEASVYMDDGAFYTFMEHVGYESADEEEEEEEEDTDEEESSDEEYEPEEADAPAKRQRRD